MICWVNYFIHTHTHTLREQAQRQSKSVAERRTAASAAVKCTWQYFAACLTFRDFYQIFNATQTRTDSCSYLLLCVCSTYSHQQRARVCPCVYATNNMRRCIDSILWQICKKKAQKSMCKAHKREINRIRCCSGRRCRKGFKDTARYKCAALWQQLHQPKWTKSQIPFGSGRGTQVKSAGVYANACSSANRKLPSGKVLKLLPTFARNSILSAFQAATLLPAFARSFI